MRRHIGRMSISKNRLGAALLAVACASFSQLGCGASAAAESAASAATPQTRAPVAPGAHGPIRLLGDALADVPLTPDQRAEIEQLAAAADARHAQSRAARADLAAQIADQVQRGAIDRAVLAPKIEALAVALQSAQPADRAAIERLHAILGPDQRVTLVDALEARFHERMGAAHEHHPLKQWADALALTPDQRDRLRAVLREQFQSARSEHREGGPFAGHPRQVGAKVLRAFREDRFVVDDVAPPLDLRALTTTMSDRFLTVAERALPILTPDQRTVAAKKLREDAAQGLGWL